MRAGQAHAGLGDEPAMEGEPGHEAPRTKREPKGASSPAEKQRRRDERARNARDRREFEKGEQSDERADQRGRQRLAKGARRGARGAPRTVRAVAPSGSAPSGTQLVAFSLLLVALYVGLQASSSVRGFLGGIAGAIRWFTDPRATIGYGAAAKGNVSQFGPAMAGVVAPGGRVATVIDQSGRVIQTGPGSTAPSPPYQPPRVKVV